MILVVVRKVGFNVSPWDSFTREFATEQEFIEWWIAQPEDSYMKRVARPQGRVSVYRSEPARDLLVEWAPPREG